MVSQSETCTESKNPCKSDGLEARRQAFFHGRVVGIP
jgi:hypothetical protein